jgi:ribonuclease R
VARHSKKRARRFKDQAAESLPRARGRISLQRQGLGFVKTEDGREIYIHPGQLGGAWNNDLVLVGILPGQSGKNPAGRVLEVLERAAQKLAALLLPQLVGEEAGPRLRLARPLDTRLGGYLLVDTSALPEKSEAGDAVLVELLPAMEQRNDGATRARALSALSSSGGRADDSVPLFETLVKSEQGLARAFSQAALDECAPLPEDPDVRAALLETGRRDARHLDFVTIDGADARDFDDAVQVEPLANGGWLLRVAIADVAHYVRPGGALDAEAATRGNSCYFPASVEPMLPEALSNGLCSLKPRRPRLAMLAEVEFNPRGLPGKTAFYPGLIQSRARLTYEETQAVLDDAALWRNDEREPLLPMLREAEKLARLLLARRLERGALSFDLPEPQVEVNPQSGRVEALRARRRLFAHQLIEEFMIAANEAVARHLAAAGLPFLYRAHPAPDPEKLLALAGTLERNGLALQRSARPGRGQAERPPDLQAILDQARGRPEEFVVNRLLLRGLMQARYTPEPEGHFGLASEAYCHFTSPIRRHADLTVHRALRRSLGLPERLPGPAELARIGESLNECERRAVEAERDIHKICAALYLRQREDREPHRLYPAVVAGLSSFGLFVELAEMPAEGFVPAEALADDFYRLDSASQMLVGLRHGHIYRLGQPLAVLLDQVDPLRREIRFRPAPDGAPGQPGAGRGRHGKNKKSRSAQNGGPEQKTKRQRLPKGSVRIRKKQP